MGEVAHLQAAVSRLKGKPFELLMISLDSSATIAGDLVKALKIPGTQAWDESGAKNSVSSLYNVQNLPSWYLLDANGVIRSRDPFGDRLIPAINAALALSKSKAP